MIHPWHERPRCVVKYARTRVKRAAEGVTLKLLLTCLDLIRVRSRVRVRVRVRLHLCTKPRVL